MYFWLFKFTCTSFSLEPWPSLYVCLGTVWLRHEQQVVISSFTLFLGGLTEKSALFVRKNRISTLDCLAAPFCSRVVFAIGLMVPAESFAVTCDLTSHPSSSLSKHRNSSLIHFIKSPWLRTMLSVCIAGRQSSEYINSSWIENLTCIIVYAPVSVM